MVGLLGIRSGHIGDDTLEVIMSIDSRTRQSSGLLYGSTSVVLAESTGSAVGYLCIRDKRKVVGLEINASHIRSTRERRVRDICKPLHLGSCH